MIKILILGGGFGGIRCALDLERKFAMSLSKNEAEITLIDRNSYHLFTPAIYEVASAYGIKKDAFAVQLKKTVCIPYADIFTGKKINFLAGEIVDVNLISKRVMTRGGRVLEYDHLVIGLGSEVYDYNIPGVTEYAYQFKNLSDALLINQKLEELSEQFVGGQRTEPFSFIICGGGFTGVELAAELGCCSGAIKQKCKLKGRCSTISLFEAGPKILPAITEKERKIVKQRLTKLGVIIMENAIIEEVSSNSVKLKNGQKVEGDLVIWTAGIRANRMLAGIDGLPLSANGKIIVESNLVVKGFDNVYGIGDSIEFIDPENQRQIPGLAYIAIDEGKIAAKNIYNRVYKKKLQSYKPFYGVYVLPVGGKYAISHLFGGVMIKGFLGWLGRVAIDIRYFLSILPVQKAFKLYWEEVSIFLKND